MPNRYDVINLKLKSDIIKCFREARINHTEPRVNMIKFYQEDLPYLFNSKDLTKDQVSRFIEVFFSIIEELTLEELKILQQTK